MNQQQRVGEPMEIVGQCTFRSPIELRFVGPRKIEVYEEVAKVPVEGVLTHRLVDPATGEDALHDDFVSVRVLSPASSVVEVGTLGSGQEYLLQREEYHCVVVHERLIWIS